MSMPPLGNQYTTRVTGTVAASEIPKLRHQIDTYLHKRNSNAPAVGQYYAAIGAKFGIRPEIAAAQAIIETASFKFTGQVPANFYNPCGMKCSGTFMRFANWEQGIHAHFERLNSYVRPQDESGEGGQYDACYGHWRYEEIRKAGYNPDSVMGVVWLWTGACDPKDPRYDLCIDSKLRYAQGVVQHAEAILKTLYTPGTPEPRPQPGIPQVALWVWLLAGAGILGTITYYQYCKRR